jgi:hypothetical protein
MPIQFKVLFALVLMAAILLSVYSAVRPADDVTPAAKIDRSRNDPRATDPATVSTTGSARKGGLSNFPNK